MITTVVIITYLSLIIGELVPKSIALSNPERYATLFSPIMILLTKVSYPFVWFLSISTRLLNRIIGVKNEERPMTQEEIKMILHQSSEQGVIDKEETEMLRDVFRFSDKRANELMTHRRDLVIFHPDDTKRQGDEDNRRRTLQQISVGGRAERRDYRCGIRQRYYSDGRQ